MQGKREAEERVAGGERERGMEEEEGEIGR